VVLSFSITLFYQGGLAQLARALALHARGHRFDSDILHKLSIFGYSKFFDILELIEVVKKEES
jgi:hypothetical protein